MAGESVRAACVVDPLGSRQINTRRGKKLPYNDSLQFKD